nr:hypothetical protein [Acinetobacter johnsonii]
MKVFWQRGYAGTSIQDLVEGTESFLAKRLRWNKYSRLSRGHWPRTWQPL